MREDIKTSNNYILFWLSQAVSELGSMMTSYALIIWSYTQTQSVMSVSLLTFFTFLESFGKYFIETLIDRKIIMMTIRISLCS